MIFLQVISLAGKQKECCAMQPRPHRYAKGCRRGLRFTFQTPLQICSSESSLELLLAKPSLELRTTRLIVLYFYWQSMRSCAHWASAMLSDSFTQVKRRTDV